jgi:outer membrane protein TolC
MKRIILLAFSFFLFQFQSKAQVDTLEVSLEEVVALAQSDAPDALAAAMQLKNRYWSYQTFLADYKPSLSFSGQLPSLNRSIGPITLPDGTNKFVRQSNLFNSARIALSQGITKTGGTIFAGTGLSRLDQLNQGTDNITSYVSTPFYVGIDQPIFGYNQLKWDKKIRPLQYQEATRAYAERMESVAADASSLFFDVLIAQLNLRSAIRDKANADTLYNISKGRFEVGRIAETELLQIELSSMNADAAVQRALLDLQTGTERLRNFLGLKKAVFFKMDTPESIPDFMVNGDDALKYANLYRSDVIRFERTLTEADAGVEEAKAQRGFQMNLSGEVGFTQSGNTVGDAYNSLESNQVVGLSINVPILNWGRGEARLETAYTQRELDRLNVSQEKVQFEQEILLKVKQFDLLRNQVALSKRAYDVSLKREQMTRNRYYIGKIDVLDLGVAVTEKENARVSYVSALRAFWLAHYDLRRSTMFDFERNVSLVKKLEGY